MYMCTHIYIYIYIYIHPSEGAPGSWAEDQPQRGPRRPSDTIINNDYITLYITLLLCVCMYIYIYIYTSLSLCVCNN